MGKKNDGEKAVGSTSIADAVVAKVSAMAAGEVQGVRLGSSTAQAAGSVLSSITGGGGRTQGVSVEVGEKEAAVDLTMTTEYGKSIPQLTQAVRDSVVKNVESLTGLAITEANVTVSDVYFPHEEQNRE